MAATREFQALPSTEEIQQLKRELQFHPCQIGDPRFLTREQVDAFNRDGYIKGIRIFSDSEITDIRAYFDTLLEKVLAEGGNSYSISTAHARHGKVWDLLTHDRITRCVRDLLGDDVIGWGSHFFCKMPKDGKVVYWHQDASYWPLSPSKAITVWLAIDDADVENACMRYLPGSHHYGHLTYRLREDDPDFLLNQEVVGLDQFGEPVNVELKAGEISIHSDLLLHGSEANHSDRRRCGLTMRYTTPDVRADLGWNEKGVWVSGGDPSGHWANNPRPDQD